MQIPQKEGLFYPSATASTTATTITTTQPLVNSPPPKVNVLPPKAPSWLSNRAYMNNTYLLQKPYEAPLSQNSNHSHNIQKLPPLAQEMILIDEILSAMIAFEGKYICLTRKDNSFSDVPNNIGHNGALSSKLDSFSSYLPVLNHQSNNNERESEAYFYLKQGNWEPSLAYLVQRILPICNKYISISNFVQIRDCSYEYGLVSQAFVAAVKVLIREYVTFAAQLESMFQKQTLTLQQIWLHIQQPLRTLDTLETLTRKIQACKAKGGKLLSIIHEISSAMGGDPETKKLFQFLMEKACVPFFNMVNDWVLSGKLDDMYSEFMICYNTAPESEYDQAAAYWEKRFTIRTDQVPDFLNEAITTKILQSGKYLNVIRYASKTMDWNVSFIDSSTDSTKLEKIDYTSHKREYVTKIDASYSYASQQLVKHILEKHKLLDLLNTLRDVFLFKRGDFFVHFIDNSESELMKKASLIIPSKIQSLLELSLKTSTVKDVAGLTAELSPLPISFILDTLSRGEVPDLSNMGTLKDAYSLNGIEAFTIKPTVSFPLSIVVNRNNILRYQLLFRHLLQCKCVERALLKAWIEHKYCREFSLGNTVAPLYGIRQRMLHFVRELLFFSFNEIERNFVVMEKKIRKAGTLDEIILHHQQFLDNCMTISMLSLQKPFRALSQVLTVCKIFSDFMIQFTIGLTLEDESLGRGGKRGKNSDENSSTLDILAKRRTQLKIISEHARQNAQSQFHLNSIAKFKKNFEDSFQLLVDTLRTSGGEATQLATHFAQIFS
jgi:gamma-tubulin complex component 2